MHCLMLDTVVQLSMESFGEHIRETIMTLFVHILHDLRRLCAGILFFVVVQAPQGLSRRPPALVPPRRQLDGVLAGPAGSADLTSAQLTVFRAFGHV